MGSAVMSSRARRLLPLAAVFIAVASACQFDAVSVPSGRERPVVHSVLNPWATEQVVLLERTLTGRVTVNDEQPYDRQNPIVTAGGVAISNARVVLYAASGDSAVAVEDLKTRGTGAGVYRIGNAAVPSNPGSPPLPRLAIVPGGTYRLRITTPDGDTVTGATTLPRTPGVAPVERARLFNRDRDTLNLFWDPIPQTQRYLIRIESPWGPMFLFTDGLEARLPGTLRNIFQENLPRVFLPGFRSRVSVAAIDMNYFDYFRSANDPFTGSGLISRLDGAVGVFGSMAELYAYRTLVSADLDDPFEGVYEFRGPADFAPTAIKLYIESSVGKFSFITGEHSGSLAFEPASIVGVRTGDRLSLAFLQFSNDVSDTLAVFVGDVVGDSLIGVADLRDGGRRQAVRYGKVRR